MLRCSSLRPQLLTGTLLLLLLGTACGGSNSLPTASSAKSATGGSSRSGAASQAPQSSAPAPLTASTDGTNPAVSLAAQPAPAAQGNAVNANPQAANFDRKIIRNADLGLTVGDTEAAINSVMQIAGSLGGYVAGSTITRSGESLHGSVTVRVPADHFDQAMTQVKRLGLRVERENVSGQDVTEEYADLGARIRNLQATEDQLRELLATVRERSNSANDILAVSRELTTVRGQIEQAQGRMQYLDKLSELATISIELIPQLPAKPSVRPQPAPVAAFETAISALRHAGELALLATIWLGVFVLPLTVILALPVAAFYLARRRWPSLRPPAGVP